VKCTEKYGYGHTVYRVRIIPDKYRLSLPVGLLTVVSSRFSWPLNTRGGIVTGNKKKLFLWYNTTNSLQEKYEHAGLWRQLYTYITSGFGIRNMKRLILYHGV